MCTNMRVMKTENGLLKHIPCKYLCTECRNMRREDFTQRLKFEYQNYNYLGAFISLTYRDDDLPLLLPLGSAVVGSFFGSIPPAFGSTLLRSDLSKFTDNMQKRLRRKFGRIGKYIGFGDYGEDTHRPHYHLIYIGCPVERSLIYDTWKHGNIDVRPINDARIRYVLNYINKDPIFPDSKYELYGDFEPPFYHYSKGLGFEEIYNLYESGQVDIFGQINFSDNHKYTIPPYLKNKLGLSSKLQFYPDSAYEWKNEKGFNDIEEAFQNRCKVVERVNTQKVIARGKYKIDFIKAQDNESLDRLQRFNGFTDYQNLDNLLGFG